MKIGLNRNQIKYIAAAAMLIDHIGMFFVPTTNIAGWICRIIGRLTAPIMCYFLAEGYKYTSSKIKYVERLFIFAVISQFAYAFSHGNNILKLDFNVIYTLFICFVILCCYDMIKNNIVKWITIASLFVLTFIGDWGIIAPLWVLTFWIYRDSRKKQVISYSVIAAFVVLADMAVLPTKGFHWYGELWQVGLFMFIPLIYMYNGQKGKSGSFSKWFFYFFYPVHLAILGLIKFHLI